MRFHGRPRRWAGAGLARRGLRQPVNSGLGACHGESTDPASR